MAKITLSTTKKSTYENNPFYVATQGLELLFKKAQSVGIALAVLSAIVLVSSLPSYSFPNYSQPTSDDTATSAQKAAGDNPFSTVPVEVWVMAGIVLLLGILLFSFIGIVVRGVSDYASAQLALSKTTTLREALNAVFGQFWSYTWVLVIVMVKTVLWSLLFIIPGFVMSYRYSLAGVSFFAGKGRGNAPIAHSSSLVKGAWLTTYASQMLLNIITLGFIQPLLVAGTNAVLYRQLSAVGDKKPKAHILSWLTLIVPILGAILLIFAVLAFIAYIVTRQTA